MPIDRTWYNTLVNDDGTNTLGTPWTKEAVDSLLDAIDAMESGAEYQKGVQSSATLAAGNNNNVAISASTRIFRLAGDSGGTSAITGFSGGSDGRIVTLFNTLTFTITLKHLTTSSFGNQIVTSNNGADFILNAYDAVDIWYDVINSFWRTKGF